MDVKTRKNVDIKVTIQINQQVVSYQMETLAKSEKSISGEFDMKQISTNIKQLVIDAKQSVQEVLEVIQQRDEEEQLKKEKSESLNT